ncbi:MAG: NADP-dependent phosphogluconate dehydrogenase [Thermomicrobiales bacterium]
MTETSAPAATAGTIETKQRHVGVVGLAVMGENLALNIERNGFPISVYNRTTTRTDEFMATSGAGLDIHASATIPDFVSSLARPRRILLMVKAGLPVDAVIEELAAYLEPGDILIDGGNSLFTDTERRSTAIAARGFNFVGMGVSGGEEGALWGPSLMPGGPADAYTILEPMLTAISAKTEAGPCVTHIGPGGAGHYVKMVHNGIEYGDMQLIAETYDIMKRALGMTPDEMAQVFHDWNDGELSSFLVQMTADVLAFKDPETGGPLVEIILDEAEQKGTGRWTSQNALELATPIPTIDAAVFARSISSMKAKRVVASKVLKGPDASMPASAPMDAQERQAIFAELGHALLFAKISSYAQGMALLRAASDLYGWNLNLAEIGRIWKGGCIIRAKLLDPIRAAFGDDPALDNLLLAPYFTDKINATMAAARKAVILAVQHGIPTPAMGNALNYVDSYRTERLPANLIQGLRDDFGAHTYKRLDKDGVFHSVWAPYDDAPRGDAPGPAGKKSEA